jgi:hypothetical protein
VNARADLFERLLFLADVVTREASYLSQTNGRLFANVFGPAEVAGLPDNPDLGERVDAFVSRFGRLQDTLAGALLPRLLEALLEPVGSVLDNVNRAERLGWLRSASEWAELRLLRNRMIHEYVRDVQELVDALQAAHRGVPDLTAAAAVMAQRARELARSRAE